jgi:hypothetical protein
MCIAFTTRNEDLRRRRRKRGNAAKMRISAKIVLFLRILRLLVVARKSSREKSSDDAFHSFFVSFGLKHFASLLYTQKDKYNLHTLRAIEREE